MIVDSIKFGKFGYFMVVCNYSKSCRNLLETLKEFNKIKEIGFLCLYYSFQIQEIRMQSKQYIDPLTKPKSSSDDASNSIYGRCGIQNTCT